MRLLADENIPGDAVVALRLAGHDVAWVRLDAPGSVDRDVLARAQAETHILLTFDKDFGELAWRERLPAACGVVLFRLPMPAPGDAGRVIAEIVKGDPTGPGIFPLLRLTVSGCARRSHRRFPPGASRPALMPP